MTHYLTNDGNRPITAGAGTAGYILTATNTTGNFEWQAAPAGADNLGNHNATQRLDMGGFNIRHVNLITASDTESATTEAAIDFNAGGTLVLNAPTGQNVNITINGAERFRVADTLTTILTAGLDINTKTAINTRLITTGTDTTATNAYLNLFPSGTATTLNSASNGMIFSVGGTSKIVIAAADIDMLMDVDMNSNDILSVVSVRSSTGTTEPLISFDTAGNTCVVTADVFGVELISGTDIMTTSSSEIDFHVDLNMNSNDILSVVSVRASTGTTEPLISFDTAANACVITADVFAHELISGTDIIVSSSSEVDISVAVDIHGTLRIQSGATTYFNLFNSGYINFNQSVADGTNTGDLWRGDGASANLKYLDAGGVVALT